MDTLLADDGTPLATISHFHAAADRSWRFKILGGSGRVLDFYFHHGGRRVLVVAGDSVLRGHLKTKWVDGRRHWQLESLTTGSPLPAQERPSVAARTANVADVPPNGPGDPLAEGRTTLTPTPRQSHTPDETYARSANP